MKCIHGVHHTQHCEECGPHETHLYLCSCGYLFDPACVVEKGFRNAHLEFFDHMGDGHEIVKIFPEGTLVIMED